MENQNEQTKEKIMPENRVYKGYKTYTDNMRLTTETLESRLEALRLILYTPLTLHNQTYNEAVDDYNILNLVYKLKTGREYRVSESVKQN